MVGGLIYPSRRLGLGQADRLTPGRGPFHCSGGRSTHQPEGGMTFFFSAAFREGMPRFLAIAFKKIFNLIFIGISIKPLADNLLTHRQCSGRDVNGNGNGNTMPVEPARKFSDCLWCRSI